MYLIVGLGNPEPEYSYTRHNMGFDVINKIAKKCEIDISRTKFNGLYGSGIIKDEKVILLKPQTYMNLSGQSIKPFADFYKIPLENVYYVLHYLYLANYIVFLYILELFLPTLLQFHLNHSQLFAL